MKFFIVLALIYSTSALRLDKEYVDQEFDKFKREFGRSYNLVDEELRRRDIFEDNLNFIYNHNFEEFNGLHTYRLAVNQFADMTNEEFRRTVNGFKPELRIKQNNTIYREVSNDLPDTVDWRTKGIVTEVKNQGQCGSCWAFSSIHSIEGQLALNTKKLVSLSAQNLMDCSTPEGNQGCCGGLMDQAFEYVIKNNGIDSEAAYPYKAVDDPCTFKRKSVSARLTGFTDVKSGDEKALQSAVANIGPIATAVDASQQTFQFYSSGVYDDSQCSSQNVDHTLTTVGYGVLNGKDYWLNKNSWGITWGEKGYILMSRNKDNQCGIATVASFPTGVTN